MDLIKIIKSLILTCELCRKSSIENICKKCLDQLSNWNGCFSCTGFCNCKFSSLALWKYDIFSKSLILKFKYNDAVHLKELFTNLLLEKINKIISLLDFKQNILVVPVPTSRKRLFERGYNPSVILAKEISYYGHFNLDLFFFKKTKYTLQKDNDTFIRSKNAESIILNKFPNQYDVIIIVDDLVASGSTIMRCYDLAKEYAKHIILSSVLKTE